MAANEALLEADTHFAFGENWRSFATTIDGSAVARSDAGLARIFSPGELQGKTVIDIGCGSGLPALSILRAGATHVTCVDIDPNSVAATAATLSRHADTLSWSAEVASVFDISGQYDVVYSWGVLHHTGDMWRAIDKAASLVRPGGTLCIAIYAKTKLCAFWTVEKRIYSKAPKLGQAAIRVTYKAAKMFYGALKAIRGGRLPPRPEPTRGMDREHDLHDWLGGYPYESARPEEVRAFLTARGFTAVRENVADSPLGLGSSGCDEYVFAKPA